MDDLANVLAGLRREYLADVPSRLRELGEDVAAFRSGNAAALQSLKARCHRLAGSGGSYGFPDVSRIARRVEQWIASEQPPVPADAPELERAIGEIGQAFKRYDATPAESPVSLGRDAEWRALVVAEEGPVRDRIVVTLRRADMVVNSIPERPLAGEPSDVGRPDLVVIATQGGSGDPYALAAAWSARRAPRPRAVVLIDDTGVIDRLRTIPAGIDAVFATDQIERELLGYAQVLTLLGAPPASVLLVEDDKEQADLIRSWLTRARMRVSTAASAIDAADMLARDLPDLILLDIGLPEVDGLAFARMVREDPRFSLIPIVFLTVRSGTADKIAAIRAGADDFLGKPVDQQLLLQVVTNRAERGRRIREMVHRDGLTGLLNHATLMAELEHATEYAKRVGEPVSFLMVDLDHFKQVNDRFGHLVGDQVLLHVASVFQKATRASDLIGRYGGEEFGLILRRTGREGALAVARKLRESLTAEPARRPQDVVITIKASIGIASYPEDGSTGPELAAAADSALYRAKELGRDRIEVAKGRE